MLFLLGGGFSIAQNGLFVNDSLGGIRVMHNTFISIDGDLQMLKAFPNPLNKMFNGQVYLTGNLVTTDTLYFERQDSVPGIKPAQIHFIGNTDSRILGTIPPKLSQVIINKSAGNVLAESGFELHDTIRFQSGNVIIDTNVLVELVYHTGTNSVDSNPWLIGESAQHRFTGEGMLHTTFPIAAGHELSVANTGFFFYGHQSDTLNLYRGHKKMLYAGNGSIDRFFDVAFVNSMLNNINHDTISLKYLGDVNYAAMGVDANRLGVFVSPQFQDMDFRRIPAQQFPAQDSASLTNGAHFALPQVNVSPAFYRVTFADTLCNQIPVSALPDTMLHICAGDSALVQVPGAGHPYPVYCFWADGSQASSRYVHPASVQQQLIVRLIDSRGCALTDTLFIDSTASAPVAHFTWDDACFGDSVYVHNGSTINPGTFTSSWAFGNNTFQVSADSTIGIHYATPGTYVVSLHLESNYGCTADTSHQVDVFNLPTASFTLTENCFYDVFQADGSASTGITIPSSYAVTSYNWFLDNALLPNTTSTFNLTPPAVGNHTLDLVVAAGGGCSDTLQQAFTVFAPDTASFTISNACAGQTVTISNTSLIQNSGATYFWTFGDGTTSTAATPVKTYANPGTYSVKLIVSTDANCADTATTSVTIYGLPPVSFTAGNSCVFVLNAPMPDVIDNNLTYSWNFGDGYTSAQITPQHAYGVSGTYTISLDVSNSNGCSSHQEVPVTIYTAPNASFNNTTACLGNGTQFYSNASGTGLSYSWNFGDLTQSALMNPVHAYAAAGNYPVQQIVTDLNGCSDTTVHTVVVNALPSVSFGTISTCGSQYVLNAQNPGSTYLWSPGNQTTQSIQVLQSGTYSVSVTNANGCSSSAAANVTLNSIVSPDLGADTSICGTVLFDAHYPGSTYLWQDGSTAQTFTASAAGTYWVQVTDQNGCVGADTVEVQNVFAAAAPNLGPDQLLCSTSQSVTLTPGTFASYSWNTGSQTPSIQVNTSGYYIVSVTTADGCSGKDTVSVQFNSSPVTSLPNNVTGCDNTTLVGASNPGYQYLWNDGNTNQIRTISTSGTYSVIVTNPSNGCTSYDTTVVQINPTPVVNLGPDATVCSNTPLQLNAPQIAGASYSWTSSSNAVVSTTSSYVPTSSDTYVVTVNTQGCSASDAISVTLLPAPYVPQHASVYYICGTTPVTLNGSLFGQNNWTSSFGLISQQQNLTVYETGSYYLQAAVAGCHVADTFKLETSPSQIQAMYMVDNDTTKNNALKFIDLSEPTPLSYHWDFGDGTFDTIPYPVHEYSFVDTFYTSLTVSNGICISTYQKMVNQKDFMPHDLNPNPGASLDFDQVNVYPNPSSGLLHVEIGLNNKADLKVVLVNPLGQQLKADFLNEVNSYYVDYDLTEFAQGMYYVHVTAESLKGKISRMFKVLKTNY